MEIPVFYNFLGKSIGDDEIRAFRFQYESNISAWRDEDAIFWEFKIFGFSFSFKEHPSEESNFFLSAIHIYTLGTDGYHPYKGSLPLELSLDSGMDQVRMKLGEPIKSSKGGIFLGKVIRPWEKFRFQNHYIHLEYDQNGSIALLTLLN